MALYNRGRNAWRQNVSEEYRRYSDYIVQCARKCFETYGVKKTTIASITREADMTRELFYYYYSNKQEILNRVIDSYVQDAIETAQLWCDIWERKLLNSDTLPREAVVDAIAAIRRFVFSANGSQRSMFSVLSETEQPQKIYSRMCNAVLRALRGRIALQAITSTFPQLGGTGDEYMFKFVVFGAIGLMEGDMSDDETIADVLLSSAVSYA